MSRPGKVCCVLDCTQRGTSKNISYHKVPSLKTNNPMRLHWLKRIRRRDYIYTPVSFIYVCSKHFKPSDYQTGRANNMKYLKEGAVPSIFPWDFVSGTKLDDSMQPTEPNSFCSEDQVLSDKDTIVVSTEKCIEFPKTNDKCECSKISKKVKELEANLEKLILKVSIQKRVIDNQKNTIRKVRKEKHEAMKQAEISEKCLNEFKPSLDRIKDNNKDISFYTGLPNYEKLEALYNRLNPGTNGENIKFWNSGNISVLGCPKKLNVKDQFLLVMMRLRLGLFVKDLADRFAIAPSTASNYCISWINFMYIRLGQISIWATREQIDATMPEDFKTDYPSTRVIIDATELKCQAPKSLVLQSAAYSNYKSTTTFKGLLGISPNGYVTFVSQLFTGSISDQELTRRSGFLKLKFAPNDSVMADKGFLIEKMLNEKGVKLNIPPFLGEKRQFTKEELEKTQKIAALRIHVERRIARIRGFHILDRPIPLTLAPVVNQLWTVLTLLSNFQSPLIRNMENINNTSLQSVDFVEVLEEEVIVEPENVSIEDDFQEEILEPENASIEDESDFLDKVTSDESEYEENIQQIINLNTSSEDD